jgi:hypothetical protein
MKIIKYSIGIIIFLLQLNFTFAQEEAKLKLSGEFLSDQRFLFKDDNQWVWNENRLSLNLDKKITDKSAFHTDVWLRNFGLPEYSSASDLYNKGIIDPYDIEIREAYIELPGFLFDNLDMKIGRQRIAWGTGDKLNPTDNLNPYDFEDILDFGRHRGSDAININFYLNDKFSLQGVYIPFWQASNLPVGIFSDVLIQPFVVPEGLILTGLSDTLIMPAYNFAERSVAGFKFKGFAAGFDFSVSYVWGRDAMPYTSYNTFIPVDMLGGIEIHSQLNYARQHVIGFDMAGNIGGIGVWGELAGYLPDTEIHMINDLSALYPFSPEPVLEDSVLLEQKVYTKFVVGADYFFANGSYLNFQYLHGFVHENGENLNDYFFLNYEMKFFEDKLLIRPIAAGFILSDWEDISNNYALMYIPEISYQATDNANLSIAGAFFDGKGNTLFSDFSDKNMMMLKFTYNF